MDWFDRALFFILPFLCTPVLMLWHFYNADFGACMAYLVPRDQGPEAPVTSQLHRSMQRGLESDTHCPVYIKLK